MGPVFQVDYADLKAQEPDLPRLEEVLALKEAFPQAVFNVELKSFPGLGEEAARRLAALLRGREGVWVSSFDPLALLALRKAAPGLPLGFLMAEDHSALLPCLGVEAVHPHHALVTEEAVAGWRKRGLFVVAWTVNEEGEARRLLALGLDGLIGDRPEVLLPLGGEVALLGILALLYLGTLLVTEGAGGLVGPSGRRLLSRLRGFPLGLAALLLGAASGSGTGLSLLGRGLLQVGVLPLYEAALLALGGTLGATVLVAVAGLGNRTLAFAALSLALALEVLKRGQGRTASSSASASSSWAWTSPGGRPWGRGPGWEAFPLGPLPRRASFGLRRGLGEPRGPPRPGPRRGGGGARGDPRLGPGRGRGVHGARPPPLHPGKPPPRPRPPLPPPGPRPPPALRPEPGRLPRPRGLPRPRLPRLPLAYPLWERLAARLAPSPKPLAPKYLRPEALNDPLLAQGLALEELARIGDAARHMLEGVLKALVQETGHEAELLPLEEKVDRLSREVLVYVAKLPQDTPALPLLKAASELEHLADLAKRALRKAERLWTQGVTFSPEGKAELARIVGRTLARLERALTALATGNRALAERVLAEYPEVLAEVEASREAHLRRLRDRVETRASTLTHLDLLLLLEELNLGVNRLARLVEEIHKEG